mmetsp:Transcript_10149/g.29555  ORF Transcript_10149/g.29555 Transcript_10149/m.29555 type:complete len:213 (-) Transcript_10149:77-715(-)
MTEVVADQVPRVVEVEIAPSGLHELLASHLPHGRRGRSVHDNLARTAALAAEGAASATAARAPAAWHGVIARSRRARAAAAWPLAAKTAAEGARAAARGGSAEGAAEAAVAGRQGVLPDATEIMGTASDVDQRRELPGLPHGRRVQRVARAASALTAAAWSRGARAAAEAAATATRTRGARPGPHGPAAALRGAGASGRKSIEAFDHWNIGR